MTFSREADCLKLLTGGPWFYGRSMFSLTTYERKEDPATVSIRGFPTWVEILGIPLRLMTEEAGEKIGSTLGDMINLDKNNIRQVFRALPVFPSAGSAAPPPLLPESDDSPPAVRPSAALPLVLHRQPISPLRHYPSFFTLRFQAPKYDCRA
ncbi:hypothetical protein ACLB2K_060432 [Fragaria x ananassa]